MRPFTFFSMSLALVACGGSGVISGGSTGGTGTPSSASGTSATGTSSATGSTSGQQSTTSGGLADAGLRCDQTDIRWTGPAENSGGSCLYDLEAFVIAWGSVAAGPYPSALNVGLPCTAGQTVACGDGGSVVQLNCSYRLSGLTDGLTYFVTEAVSFNGMSGPSAPESQTILCGYDGGSPCVTASDCPPYLMCDIDAGGVCDFTCQGAGCACDADSQCEATTQSGGLGEGWTCINGFCASGCVSPTDCGLGSCCDVTNGLPGTCVLPPETPTAQCLCAGDNQCNGVGGQDDEPSLGFICSPQDNCVPGCKSGFDCPADEACDLSQGFPSVCINPCVGSLCSCVSPGQCVDGGPGQGVTCILSTGLCGPGCDLATDCGSTEACDLLNQTCSATCGVSDHSYECLCTSDSQCTGGVAGAPSACNGNTCALLSDGG